METVENIATIGEIFEEITPQTGEINISKLKVVAPTINLGITLVVTKTLQELAIARVAIQNSTKRSAVGVAMLFVTNVLPMDIFKLNAGMTHMVSQSL